MRLKISHRTQYRYAGAAPYALQQLRLQPKSTRGQTVRSWTTTVEGGRNEVEFYDQHNNHVALVSFEPGPGDIAVLCEGEVDTADAVGVVGPHAGCAPLWYFKRQTPLTEAGAHIGALVAAIGAEFESDVAQLHALSALIAGKVDYQIGETDAATTAEDALEAGMGVCQDHAHAFVSAARALGYPARYVSGYLMMDDRVEQSAGHAWAEAHVSDLGWVGLDISNGISPDERYVRVATGLDYRQAAPVSGLTFGGDKESMTVSLQVQQ